MSKKWFWIWICFIFTTVLAVVMIWWIWGREKYPLFEKKAGKCLVFEEKYCDKGVGFWFGEKKYLMASFSLENNSYIFSPIDGLVTKSVEDNNGKKVLAMSVVPEIKKLGSLGYAISIENGELIDGAVFRVAKGQMIARVNNEGEQRSKVTLFSYNLGPENSEKSVFDLINEEETKKFIQSYDN